MAALDLVEAIIASGNALKLLPERNPVRHGKMFENGRFSGPDMYCSTR
jgi:hypothetical protein